jgi:hypothetical protein
MAQVAAQVTEAPLTRSGTMRAQGTWIAQEAPAAVRALAPKASTPAAAQIVGSGYRSM